MSDQSAVAPFRDFSQETVRFFNGMRRTNTRDRFERNRAVYAWLAKLG